MTIFHHQPTTFPCPYCGQIATLECFEEATGFAHFSHQVTESKKVGQVTEVLLHTRHQFVMRWRGNQWRVMKAHSGCSEVCERLETKDGHFTNWRSCDKAAEAEKGE